jgi:hypothetical protein
VDGPHELVRDRAKEGLVAARQPRTARCAHHLELAPGLAGQQDGDGQARLLAESPEQLALRRIGVGVVDRAECAAALTHGPPHRGIVVHRVGLVLGKALFARPELTDVHKGPDEASLRIQTRDGERSPADCFQGSLGRQLEDILEPVRPGGHSGHVNQGAKLCLSKIPAFHGLSVKLSSSWGPH